jgi:hypothetical protein
MAVFRVEKTKDFTIMSNHHLRNTELSLKAKGLLSLMLSLPEDWDYTTKGLAHICKDGVDSITTALKELERHGYLTRQRLRYDNGQLGDIEYTIHEQPVSTENTGLSPKRENPRQVKPEQAKPKQAEPEQENPAQLNTNPLKTKKCNIWRQPRTRIWISTAYHRERQSRCFFMTKPLCIAFFHPVRRKLRPSRQSLRACGMKITGSLPLHRRI